jgi:(p)ppGpp synthase/HD superfamily hydrolase
MLLTHRLQEAINEAARLHRDQIRKDSLKTPYITHLVGVMILLSSATHDEDVLIAGLLHDALEDVEDYTEEQLEATFGKRVLDIVLGVTEESKLHRDTTPSWKEVKMAYLSRLENASDDSVLVSLADKIQNTRSLIELMTIQGTGMLPQFSGGHEERMWFHREVLAIATDRLGDDHILVEELRMELEEMDRTVQKFLTA